jgi:predicted ribosomally synthesized peptide with nif11-like leader
VKPKKQKNSKRRKIVKNLKPEMIEKAKAAKSAEELLELAKANGVEMTEDEAATYFAQLNPKSGELSDDDLDNVAGGACQSNSSGRTVVSSGCECFNGQFEHVCVNPSAGDYTLRRTDNAGLRKTWAEFAYGYGGRCGVCYHLEFEGGTGVCGKTGRSGGRN